MPKSTKALTKERNLEKNHKHNIKRIWYACVSFLSILLSNERVPQGGPMWTCSHSFGYYRVQQMWESVGSNPFVTGDKRTALFSFMYGYFKFSILLKNNKQWSVNQPFHAEKKIKLFSNVYCMCSKRDIIWILNALKGGFHLSAVKRDVFAVNGIFYACRKRQFLVPWMAIYNSHQKRTILMILFWLFKNTNAIRKEKRASHFPGDCRTHSD